MILHIAEVDWIQYALIAALFVAAWADRAPHRAYIKTTTDQHRGIVDQLNRIEAQTKPREPRA